MVTRSAAEEEAATGGAGGQPAVPLFELEDVSLAVDGQRVLHDLSLAVPDDGITVLLGPSGAGKTMLLRLLNRLEVPTGGIVRFRGEPVDGLDPLVLRRRVGMVFQRPAVFPGTVRGNLLVARPDATEEEMAAVLEAADLQPGMIDRVADELSGGEAQRVCLARTLATRPEVLLMDEPTSALDPEARHRLEATARTLAGQGIPLVWVTHDLSQAERLADHRLVLVDGRLASDHEMARFLAETETQDEDEDEAGADAGARGEGDDKAGGPGEGDDDARGPGDVEGGADAARVDEAGRAGDADGDIEAGRAGDADGDDEAGRAGDGDGARDGNGHGGSPGGR